MNKRERMMMILMGVGLALAAGRGGVKLYRDALNDYRTQITGLERDINKVKLDQAEAEFIKQRWLTEIGPQTLSMDENEAMTRLRNELYRLTDQAKLRDVRVDLGRPAPWGRNKIRVLNCTVSAQGNLDDLVAFMFELHRQPFAVRIKNLSVGQVRKGGDLARVSAADKGLLKMTARLETLLLSGNQMIEPRWIQVAKLEPEKRQPVGRTMLASLGEYKPMLDKKMFQPYEPPPPPRPTTPRQPTAPRQAERPAQVAPTPPPRDAQMIVGRLLSSPRGQFVVLEDPRQRGQAEEHREIGEEMYGGTLIFVHPQGAVTEKGGERRFHAIGEPLQNCQPLTESDQPVVYHDLLKLEARMAGINRGPG